MVSKDSSAVLSRHIWELFTLKNFYYVIRIMLFLVIVLIKLKAKYYTIRLASETKISNYSY